MSGHDLSDIRFAIAQGHRYGNQFCIRAMTFGMIVHLDTVRSRGHWSKLMVKEGNWSLKWSVRHRAVLELEAGTRRTDIRSECTAERSCPLCAPRSRNNITSSADIKRIVRGRKICPQPQTAEASAAESEFIINHSDWASVTGTSRPVQSSRVHTAIRCRNARQRTASCGRAFDCVMIMCGK